MSTRYGIELVFSPSFNSAVYRVRQLVCGQYGCWAAEMHMLRMSLLPYFECPEEGLTELAREISLAAESSRSRHPRMLLPRSGISTDESSGSVFLDFGDPDGTLANLYQMSVGAAGRVSGTKIPGFAAEFAPRVALLEYGDLEPSILADAAEYAAGAATSVDLTMTGNAWRLLIVRYSSEAAGEDWSNGRWANDVSWKQLYSYPL